MTHIAVVQHDEGIGSGLQAREPRLSLDELADGLTAFDDLRVLFEVVVEVFEMRFERSTRCLHAQSQGCQRDAEQGE